jgi:hypothetical protein
MEGLLNPFGHKYAVVIFLTNWMVIIKLVVRLGSEWRKQFQGFQNYATILLEQQTVLTENSLLL